MAYLLCDMNPNMESRKINKPSGFIDPIFN